MGEEWGETRPFLFFTDFSGELADAVRNGRRREFAAFLGKDDDIPDPNDRASFDASRLDWSMVVREPHDHILSYTRHLLRLRQFHLVPLLAGMRMSCGKILAAENGVLAVDWCTRDVTLSLRANLSGKIRSCPPTRGQILFLGPALDLRYSDDGHLSPMSVLLTLHEAPNAEPA